MAQLKQPAQYKIFIYTHKNAKPVRNSYVNNFDFDYHITLFQSFYIAYTIGITIYAFKTERRRKRKKKDNQKLAKKILYHCGRLSFTFYTYSWAFNVGIPVLVVAEIYKTKKISLSFFGIPKIKVSEYHYAVFK